MSMNIFGTKLQQGRHYMTLWPRRPELNSMFPENRVIKATEFALKVIPALAVLSVMVQFQFGELHYWPSVMASVLFLLSLPLQGYYWLGQRADTRLPPSLATWYREINGKMNEQGVNVSWWPVPATKSWPIPSTPPSSSWTNPSSTNDFPKSD